MIGKQLVDKLSLPFAIASGLLVLMLAGLLGFNEIRGKVSTLVNSKQVVLLHQDLRNQPKNEALKTRIRQLDLELRQEMFYRLRLSQNASRALLAGLALFLISANLVRLSRPRIPDPRAWGARKADDEKQSAKRSRQAVVGGAAVVAITALAASMHPVNLPEPAVQSGAPAVAAAPAFPTPEEMQQQWPSFRGANGQGVAPKATAPLSWNATAGTNVRWKTPIPLHGLSSPVVWDKAVFLTGADDKQSCVYRFDLDSGALQWSGTINLPGGARPPTPEVGESTSLAAPTPVTDGRRVYTLFPTGEIAAFDFAGKQLWARNIGPLDNTYGYAASLAIYQGCLFIQIDRGQPEDGQSHLVALDTQSGQTRWDVKRNVAGSWSSPLVVEVKGQPQLITCATPFVIAYDPVDGKEIWRKECLESDVAPSPVVAADVLVAIAPNTRIVALHPGAAEISWKSEDNVPDATSPVTDGQRLYIMPSSGMLSCYDLQSGKVLWTHDLNDEFYASPTIAGNTLVLVNRKGVAWVLETGDAYKELGRGDLGEECCASPVPIGKRLLLRGKKNLFCIETP